MPTSRGETRRRRAAAALIVVSGLATAAFRFLAASFNNDHFVHLIAARQMLSGDWPTRDFLDVGRPLLIVASAGAQWLLGPTLFAEAILVSIAFGLAAALTALVVWVITRSLWAAGAAALIEVVAFPRTYAFPKLLALALGLLVIVQYIRTPTWTRQLLMAVGTAVGFLFRHDLGLYIGIGGLLASLVSGPRTALVRGARFAALCLALVAPYLAYVHVHAGLPNHFALGAGQYESEEGYVWPNPEVAYLAQRPFAGGAYERYNFRSLPNQRRVLSWLRAERAPFALIPSASAREFENDAPLVAAYVQQRYAPLTEVPVDGEERVVILLDRTLPIVSRDDETGWPCFTAHTSWP